MSAFADILADGMTEFGAHVTSGSRPGARVRGTGRRSYHATGSAADLQIPGGDPNAHEVLAEYYRLRGLRAIVESPGSRFASPGNRAVIVHVENRASDLFTPKARATLAMPPVRKPQAVRGTEKVPTLSPVAVKEIENWWVGHPAAERTEVEAEFQRRHKGWNLGAIQRAAARVGLEPRVARALITEAAATLSRKDFAGKVGTELPAWDKEEALRAFDLSQEGMRERDASEVAFIQRGPAQGLFWGPRPYAQRRGGEGTPWPYVEAQLQHAGVSQAKIAQVRPIWQRAYKGRKRFLGPQGPVARGLGLARDFALPIAEFVAMGGMPAWGGAEIAAELAAPRIAAGRILPAGATAVRRAGATAARGGIAGGTVAGAEIPARVAAGSEMPQPLEAVAEIAQGAAGGAVLVGAVEAGGEVLTRAARALHLVQDEIRFWARPEPEAVRGPAELAPGPEPTGTFGAFVSAARPIEERGRRQRAVSAFRAATPTAAAGTREAQAQLREAEANFADFVRATRPIEKQAARQRALAAVDAAVAAREEATWRLREQREAGRGPAPGTAAAQLEQLRADLSRLEYFERELLVSGRAGAVTESAAREGRAEGQPEPAAGPTAVPKPPPATEAPAGVAVPEELRAAVERERAAEVAPAAVAPRTARPAKAGKPKPGENPMTPEIAATFQALSPEGKAKAAAAVKESVRLSDAEKAERLAILEPAVSEVTGEPVTPEAARAEAETPAAEVAPVPTRPEAPSRPTAAPAQPEMVPSAVPERPLGATPEIEAPAVPAASTHAEAERIRERADLEAERAVSAAVEDGPEADALAERALSAVDEAERQVRAFEQSAEARAATPSLAEADEALESVLDSMARGQGPTVMVRRYRVHPRGGYTPQGAAVPAYDLTQIEEAAQAAGFPATPEGMEAFRGRVLDLLRPRVQRETRFGIPTNVPSAPQGVKVFGEEGFITAPEARAALAELRASRGRFLEAVPGPRARRAAPVVPSTQPMFQGRETVGRKVLKGRPARPAEGGIGEANLTLQQPGPARAVPPPQMGLTEAAAEINRLTPEAEPPSVGLAVRVVKPSGPPGPEGRPGRPQVPVYAPAETQARVHRAMKGTPRASVGERAAEAIKRLWRMSTRTFEALPRTAKWAVEHYELTRLPARRANAAREALVRLKHIIMPLDRNDTYLFSWKVLVDDLRADLRATPETKLPFGFTPETLAETGKLVDADIAANPRVQESLKRRPQHWEEVKKTVIDAYKEVGIDISGRFQREDYFHHIVMDYAKGNEVRIMGTGQRLKAPMGRGYMRKRVGTERDISANYFESEFEVMAQMLADAETARVLAKTAFPKDIRADLERQAAKRNAELEAAGKEETATWRDFIPEGYGPWQPREGSSFFPAQTIPGRVVKELMEGLGEALIAKDDLRIILARGGRFREVVIPTELADTLENISNPPAGHPVTEAVAQVQRYWKQYILLNPRRALPYNFRNLTGDFEAVLRTFPGALRKLAQAFNEMWQMFRTEWTPEPGSRLDRYMRDTGTRGLLQAQELGDLEQIPSFRQVMPHLGREGLPVRAWRRYWWIMRKATDFRESILRYATYLDTLEQMEADLARGGSGRPKNFGATIPAEVMALPDLHQRAIKLSNEAIGAYDQLTPIGRYLRRTLAPFWSWQEVNVSRELRLWRNAFASDEAGAAIARNLGIKGVQAGRRVAQVLGGALSVTLATQLWNRVRFPDEEKSLPEYMRARPHIITGVEPDGTVRYIGRLGAVSDVLEWADLDEAPATIRAYLNGEITLAEALADVAAAPVQKVTDLLTPLIRAPTEAVYGRRLYPDWRQPRRLRSRLEPFAGTVSGTPEEELLRERDIRKYGERVWRSISGVSRLRPYTKAEGLAREIGRGEMPERGLTSEERQRSKLRVELTDELRKALTTGNESPEGAESRIREKAKSAGLTEKRISRILTDAKLTPLEASVKRMSVGDALRVYRLANDEERADLDDLVSGKIERTDVSEDERDELRAEFLKIGGRIVAGAPGSRAARTRQRRRSR